MLIRSRWLRAVWLVSILLVVAGSLLPASSPVIRAVERLPVSQKVLHFCAYTWLALLALLAIKRRSPAVLAALTHDPSRRGFGVCSEAGAWPGV